jgi:hypothetical protein
VVIVAYRRRGVGVAGGGGGGWPIGGTNRVVGVGMVWIGAPTGAGVRGARTGVTPVDGCGPVGCGGPVGWGAGVGPNSGGISDGPCGPGEPKMTGVTAGASVTGLAWLIAFPTLS